MTSVSIASLLRGCEIGRMQTVGIMQVIPLTSDLEDHRFGLPSKVSVGTDTYGTMRFSNSSDSDVVLVPTNAAYMVKQAAQDHAMATAGFIKKGSQARFDNAMCIQQTQGGTITTGDHKLAILPMSLREKALEKRQMQDYSKLWGEIATLRAETGATRGRETSGNLIEFMSYFEKELDQFVAEFERVPNQVGAIILIGGRVMGVERAPSQAYFADIWEALIRECYGSEAIRQTKKGTSAPRTMPIRPSGSLIDLKSALAEARDAEEEKAKEIVRDLIDDPFSMTKDGKNGDFVLHTITNDQFIGQIIKEDARVHYASLVTKVGWSKTNEQWRGAKAFAI